MWLLLIGLFCVLAVIGFFITGSPFKFALGGMVFLIAVVFILFIGLVVWTMMAPCSAPFTDHDSVYCETQNATANPSSTNTNTDTQTANPSEVSGASATLDQSSLFSASAKPTIKGTYSNVSGGIGLFIATQPLPNEIPSNGTPNGVVFSDGSDHGGGVDMSGYANSSSSGVYTDTLWQALPNGTYYVGIYEISTIYNSNGFQGYNTSYLLTSGTLTVTAGS
ncbi:MAG TPA: hypothetical protein VMR46_03895 [Candidatus Paceibacterota bacterium]|nr:hypothetical protein [Candidatus Paceibacterota bacterium]